MADAKTTTKTKVRTSADIRSELAAAKQTLKDLLVESGVDEGTADARLSGVAIPETNLVGNFADLQRAGGMIADGTASDFAEGVVLPPIVDAATGEATPAAPAVPV